MVISDTTNVWLNVSFMVAFIMEGGQNLKNVVLTKLFYCKTLFYCFYKDGYFATKVDVLAIKLPKNTPKNVFLHW